MITISANACVHRRNDGIAVVVSPVKFLWYRRTMITVEVNGEVIHRKVKTPKESTSSTNAYLDKKFDDVVQSMVAELHISNTMKIKHEAAQRALNNRSSKMTKAYMILDLQYGSTGKGLLAGYLAEQKQPDVVATAWMPNAGHTYIDGRGRKYVHCMLANGIVSPKLKTVLIGAGSVIDTVGLMKEITNARDNLIGKRIIIHPHAVVVTQAHRDEERKNVKIGSTMKGSGAAIVDRIARNPDASPVAEECIEQSWLDAIAQMGIAIQVSATEYDDAIRDAELIQIEGAQGYSLSIYHGQYPYTTSRDVTPAQVMADTCMPWNLDVEVYGTMRTYPIRVANRYDENGKMIGTSGGCYNDQEEIQWSDIGIEAEKTTVTKLPRRIFTFSEQQTREAIFRCAPDYIFLNFANYLTSKEQLDDMINIIEECGGNVTHIGRGATKNDVRQIDPSIG